AQPHYFGVTPATAVFGLAAASLALAVLLLAIGAWIAGAALLAAAVALTAGFLAVARRKPDSRLARASARAVTTVRTRAGVAVESLAARTAARTELLRLQRELVDLHALRSRRIAELGEAAYLGADCEEARQLVTAVDAEIAAKD